MNHSCPNRARSEWDWEPGDASVIQACYPRGYSLDFAVASGCDSLYLEGRREIPASESIPVAHTCSICIHHRRDSMDKNLLRGETLKSIALRYDISEDSVGRHKKRTVNVQAITPEEAREYDRDVLELLQQPRSTGSTFQTWHPETRSTNYCGVPWCPGHDAAIGVISWDIDRSGSRPKERHRSRSPHSRPIETSGRFGAIQRWPSDLARVEALSAGSGASTDG